MEKLKCPRCGKRVMDIGTRSPEPVEVQTKCPNCNHIVTVYWKPKVESEKREKK